MSISIHTTSRDSGIGEDIILRTNNTTQLLFRPELINNVQNSEAAVKGSFIFQKKKGSDCWEDHKELNLSSLKAEEWIKLTISSGEMLTLFTELKKYYTIHEKYGVKFGNYSFFKKDSDFEKIITLFEEKNELFTQLLNENKGELFEKTLDWIVNT